MGNLIDLTNQIFGDYKVTGFDNSKGKGKYYWKVKCIYCGNEKSIASSSLKRLLIVAKNKKQIALNKN